MFVDSQTEFGETTGAINTLVKLRSLNDVYARCNVSMIESKKYEETATDKA